jgi:uncharacterized protein YjbJ (UPF0337 family)
MDLEHVKGAIDQAKGALKELVGKLIGNTKLQREGKANKAKGTVRKGVGDVKDALKK